MKLTVSQKSTIEQVVNAFETGRAEGNYAAIAILRDGPHDIAQITYGRSQTTEFGQLRALVTSYAAAGGRFSDGLAPYANHVGTRSLVDDLAFRVLLRRAGAEDPVMQHVQDDFFERRYFAPAMKWADDHGFCLPLSALVIYDSFIHSGSMLWVIRGAFPEEVPRKGGDERAWITAYVNARHRFLAAHPRSIVRRTTYRTRCLSDEIARRNWNLDRLPIRANGVVVGMVPARGAVF